MSSVAFASVSSTSASSLPAACQSCAAYAGESHGGNISNLIFIAVLLLLATVWFYITYKKKYIIVVGSLLALLVVGSYFITPLLKPTNLTPAACPIVQNSKNADVFKAPGDEFSETPAAKPTSTVAEKVAPVSDEFTTVNDSAPAASSSEFSSASGDEFQTAQISAAPAEVKRTLNKQMIYEPIVIFLILAFISLFIKYEAFRKTKGIFLLASIIYLGFIRGACPCMISSFQNVILLGIGNKVMWKSLLWFLLLIPATYFFGRVWCGWLCHLGALQEFIYRSPKMKILTTVKAQRILKIVQISMFVLLIAQLVITHTNIWCHIDPFLVAFNLVSSNITGYVLLAIMLLSSAFIYRPFCRAFCPVGLVLGWTSSIPGAKRLTKNDSCINCLACSHECKEKAMIHEHKKTVLNTQDCIMCGDCFSSCKKGALNANRKK
jgi:NAD-dependent dihydropyrimidine dehydrogenase PreA subunit